MKIKSILFAGLTTLFAVTACQDGDPNSDYDPSLSVSPNQAIVFTAEATESFDISVSTNQESWNVISSQLWCKVTKTDNKFTVTADPNTAATAPTPAVITISAGAAQNVTIAVTQAIAATSSYPNSVEALKTAINKTWIFPATSDYISLEFGAENFILLSKKPFTKATQGNSVYLLSGGYAISPDLYTLTLTDFGTVVISAFKDEQATLVITPTGGVPATVTLTGEPIENPSASGDKRIKTLSLNIDDVPGSYTFGYTGDKLTSLRIISGVEEMQISLIYEDGQMKFEIPGEALGETGTFTATYTLNAAGLATSSVITNGTTTRNISYTYDEAKQLVSWKTSEADGKLSSYCTALWSGGDMLRTTLWRTHTCTDEYVQGDDDFGYYSHDHNNDGQFTEDDMKSSEEQNESYTYTNQVNKGGFMPPMAMPQIYEATDFFDCVALWANILGRSPQHLLSSDYKGSDGDLSYTLDNAGYPTKIDVSYPEYPKDNWNMTLTFE